MSDWSAKLIALAAVSAGCTAAAVATGSYAYWLSRRRMMEGEAYTDVHNLLETCRARVQRMEAELSTLSV